MSEEKIVIVDGARTPVGSFGGLFKDVPAHELGATAARGALARAQVDGADIAEVVMGCIGQVGPDAYNARRVAIAAGLPKNVPAYTVNRLCGSGLQAIWSAAMEMRWNGLDLALAGGDESMTRMPFYDFGARSGYRLGDRTLVDGTVMMLTDPFHNIHMGVTAENVAAKYAVSRVQQDEFAVESQRRAATAEAQAAFAEEIVEVEVGGRKPFTASQDEHPKPETTLETLASLRPAFSKDGSVTAGNASGINDGGAAVVLARESAAAERGLTPLVSLEAVATAAMEPELMGYAPVLALNALFEKTGTHAFGHRHHRAQRGLRLAGGRRHPRRQARPGEGQPVRRRHRPGPPGRRDRGDPVAPGGQGPGPPGPRARGRHHVHRWRPGAGRALPEGSVSMSRLISLGPWVPRRQRRPSGRTVPCHDGCTSPSGRDSAPTRGSCGPAGVPRLQRDDAG